MEQPLLIDPTIRMEKVAYDTRIDDDVEEWPTAVVRESYKQLPFLKSFETEVELDKIDSARGFAVGKMLVWPARMEKGAAAKNDQLVTVPVVIRNREMAPLDVYSHRDRMLPMDQDKVAQVLFRPSVFERQAPRDQFTGTNLYGNLVPPNTDHQYNAGTLHKHGAVKGWAQEDALMAAIQRETDPSKKLKLQQRLRKMEAQNLEDEYGIKSAGDRSVLSGTMHTYRVAHVDEMAEKIAADQGVRYAFLSDPMLHTILTELAMVSEKTASDHAAERRASLKPTVVQFLETEGGFLCKTANHRCFAPTTQKVSRYEAQQVLTKQAFEQLLSTGRVTVTPEAVITEPVMQKEATAVSQVGRYRTYVAGEEVEGIAIPHVVDFDGRDLGYQLFVGPESHAMQEKVAGVFLGHTKIASNRPKGLGVFVYQEGDQALAYEPVRVTHISKVAGVSQIHATRMSTGMPLRISLVNGLQKAASIGDHEIALPASVRFLSLGKSTRVPSDPGDLAAMTQEKVASAASVKLVSDGFLYSLRGEHAKLAFAEGFMLDHETEFALCALGLTGTQAQHLMKQAATRGEAVAARTRAVIPEGVRGMESMQKAAHVVRSTPDLRVDLTKELALLCAPKGQELWKQASVVLSKETADTILSLGFVTPENASLYVNYLPELEKVASKLAELLVASRLGMDDVRESAAKNAMTQVNAVIRGLENLRERIQ